MDKGTRKQLVLMQSLMERMDKHYTKYEAKAHTNLKLLNEGLDELDASNRKEVDTNEFFDMIANMPGGAKASFGYVSAANLNTPTVKKINPETNKMKSYPDWASFGETLGVGDKLGGVIKFACYTLNWRSPGNMAKHYNKDKVDPVNALRDKYGVEHIKHRPKPTTTTIDYGKGISGYAGDREELKGNTYSEQDTAGKDVQKKVYYYLVDVNGNIIKEVSVDELKPYFKERGVEGIKAFRAMAAASNKTEEEMMQLFNEYSAEILKMQVNYRRFEHSSVVYVITTVDGEKKRFFNRNLRNCIRGININPAEFEKLARQRYNIADAQTKAEDLGEFPDDLADYPDYEEEI